MSSEDAVAAVVVVDLTETTETGGGGDEGDGDGDPKVSSSNTAQEEIIEAPPEEKSSVVEEQGPPPPPTVARGRPKPYWKAIKQRRKEAKQNSLTGGAGGVDVTDSSSEAQPEQCPELTGEKINVDVDQQQDQGQSVPNPKSVSNGATTSQENTGTENGNVIVFLTPQGRPKINWKEVQEQKRNAKRYFEPGTSPELSGSGSEGESTKKRPKLGGNSASAVLNELCPNLEYHCSENLGLPHEPKFIVKVVYLPTGKEYEGEGRSKKLAKHNVAEIILTELGIPFPARDQSPSPSSDRPSTSLNTSPSYFVPVMATNPFSIPGPAPRMMLMNPLNRFVRPGFAPVPLPPPHPPPMEVEIDFASDDLFPLGVGVQVPHNLENPNPPPEPQFVSPPQPDILMKRLRRTNVEENPCSALNQIWPSTLLKYVVLSEEGPAHDKCFTLKLTLTHENGEEREFVAQGGNKKKAKSNVARLAVISILGLDNYHLLCQNPCVNPKVEAMDSNLFSTNESMAERPMETDEREFDAEYNILFADHVARLVTSRFQEVLKDDQAHLPQKVLAGVVMTRGFPLIETATVVAVASGTKCIEGDRISDSGVALNDCHAEILATRCVRDYLYSQMDMVRTRRERLANIIKAETSSGNENEENKENDFEILQVVSENPSEGFVKYGLKEGIKFHLYISTSPCGDARIFSPKGIEHLDDEDTEPPGAEDTSMDDHPNRNNRGVLRAKVEAGEGTIPVANIMSNTGSVQTWDGILAGSSLSTMSCSDKICRWNVVGIQGALLSNLMDPIYYTSITLGSLHHPVHFKRAVIGRIQPLGPIIPPPFKVNAPFLLMVTNEVPRKVKKSPNHAAVWSAGWQAHEVISAAKGRCEPGNVASRLSKRCVFLRFLKHYKNKSGRRETFQKLSYAEAKALATKFQESKEKFEKLMKDSGFGCWISKPVEQDLFTLKP